MTKGSSTIFSLILLAFVVWAGWYFFYQEKTPRVTFERTGMVINVSVADTPTEREKGLSKREYLRDDEGMIFVFETLDRHQIWMKDMNFPIDIIWLDENFKIVDIATNASVASYPNTFTPRASAGFIIEVNAGFTTKNNIKIGDTIVFERK